jgi:benzoylsuccinyl-CoA thiolase BbsB subunit
MRAAMIANPVNGVLTPYEVAYMLADSGAAALVSTTTLADGLRARGHPLGATGVAQVVEVTRHLAGRTGTGTLARRSDAGLTHCTGGGISGYDHAVCTIHILTAT